MSQNQITFRFQEAGANKVEQSIKGITGSTTAMVGSMAAMANQTLELAKKITQAAKAVYDFGKAGAAAIDMGNKFAALGAAVPGIEALKTALQGTVDETSSQNFAVLASKIGLTADEILRAGKAASSMAIDAGRAGDTALLLDAIVKGNVSTMREFGVVIDKNAESFDGLTRSAKSLEVARALGSRADELAANQVQSSALAYAQLETKIADMVSNMQVAVASALQQSGALEGLQKIVGFLSDFVARNSETFARLGDVLGKVLEPILVQFGIIMEYNMVILQAMLAVLEPLFWAFDKLVEVGSSLIGAFAKTASQGYSLNASLDSLRLKIREVIDSHTVLAEVTEEVTVQTDALFLAASFAAENGLGDMMTNSRDTARAVDLVVKSTKSLEEGLYMLDIAADAAMAGIEGYSEAGRALVAAQIVANTEAATAALEAHYESLKKTTTATRAAKVEVKELSDTFGALSNSIAGTILRMIDYRSETEQLIDRSLVATKNVISGLGDAFVAASNQKAAIGKNLEDVYSMYANTYDRINAKWTLTSDERSANVDDMNKAELKAIMSTGQAYIQAAGGVLDALGPIADLGVFKAALGFLEATAAGFMAFTEGNIPGVISAGAAAANYLLMEATAKSKNTSGGSRAASGAGAGAQAQASRTPSELDRGGRGMGGQTLVMQVGERVFGEVLIGSANKAGRNSSMKFDRSLVGTTSTRRGRI